MRFVGAAEPLTRTGFRTVMARLDVAAPELLAVLAVESRGCGFLPDRRPKILFEWHCFHKLTRGRFSAAHPDLSQSTPGGYLGGADEYARLERALALDHDAALQSASWGAGQVMGFCHAELGYASVDALVDAMTRGEDGQLDAVGRYLRHKGLAAALRAHDWAAVARCYNGPAYAKNKYDLRLAGAHQQYAGGVLPDVQVRRAQLYLTYLGLAPGAVDGVHGKMSRSAVVRWREAAGQGSSDRVDTALLDALQAAVAALPGPT
jgi:hypothetical protein